MKSPFIKVATIVLAVVAVVLLVVLLIRRRGEKTNLTNLPRFVPAGDFSGAKWPNPNDVQKCLDAFSQVDMTCQNNPLSDKIACSDYPFFYCNGALRGSGDLDQGNCPYGSPVAYSASECNNPRTTTMNSAYLCGGTLDPCVEKEKTRMDCSARAPPNPWGATNMCNPQ